MTTIQGLILMLLAVLGRLVKESGSWAVTPIITDPVQRLFNFLIQTLCWKRFEEKIGKATENKGGNFGGAQARVFLSDCRQTEVCSLLQLESCWISFRTRFVYNFCERQTSKIQAHAWDPPHVSRALWVSRVCLYFTCLLSLANIRDYAQSTFHLSQSDPRWGLIRPQFSIREVLLRSDQWKAKKKGRSVGYHWPFLYHREKRLSYLKQVVIWQRLFTQHYSVIITVHSPCSCAITVQCNELAAVLVEQKSE